MSPDSPADRDRDGSHRPRSARPRDALGRPLARGAEGVSRQPEGVPRTTQETLAEAQRLFDAGRPFHAHEVLEDAWKAAATADRRLWRALAQLAVGATHAARGNRRGARALLGRGADALAPLRGARPAGVDVSAVVTWAAESIERVDVECPVLLASPPLDSSR